MCSKVEMSWKDIDVLVKYKILDEQRAEILWHYLHSGPHLVVDDASRPLLLSSLLIVFL